MNNAQDRREEELVFMVAGDDENGDHHIFVTVDRRRAEARHQAMLSTFMAIKANWLDRQ